MNNYKKIEEAIKEKMIEIEAQEGIKQPDSYFMLEGLLKDYGWKCWRKGANAYGIEHQS